MLSRVWRTSKRSSGWINAFQQDHSCPMFQKCACTYRPGTESGAGTVAARKPRHGLRRACTTPPVRRGTGAKAAEESARSILQQHTEGAAA